MAKTLATAEELQDLAIQDLTARVANLEAALKSADAKFLALSAAVNGEIAVGGSLLTQLNSLKATFEAFKSAPLEETCTSLTKKIGVEAWIVQPPKAEAGSSVRRGLRAAACGRSGSGVSLRRW